jgi:hypothetical protein
MIPAAMPVPRPLQPLRRLGLSACGAFLALGLAMPAAFAAAGEGRAAPPVRLVSPAAGAALAPGAEAELEWTPLASFSHLPAAEEWEAFLSLDGGATYPVRITPHLDQELRRVRFRVPDLPAADARILLRFGDERRETVVAPTGRFSIAGPLRPSLFLGMPAPASAAGEPAIPGHAGVVAWVEGSRRGGALREVVAAERPSLSARLAPPAAHEGEAVLASEPAPPQPSGPPPGEGRPSDPFSTYRSARSRAGSGPLLASDLRLLMQRQNE